MILRSRGGQLKIEIDLKKLREWFNTSSNGFHKIENGNEIEYRLVAKPFLSISSKFEKV